VGNALFVRYLSSPFDLLLEDMILLSNLTWRFTDVMDIQDSYLPQ